MFRLLVLTAAVAVLVAGVLTRVGPVPDTAAAAPLNPQKLPALAPEKSGPPAATAKPPASFAGRTGADKLRLLEQSGGSEESERAVALGLAWLAKQQKADGSWVFDGQSKQDTIAATGMCVLPFLAAGETHKVARQYRQTVDRGLKYLVTQMKPDGSFQGRGLTMYSHGIAALALCEAYGMTQDPILRRPAQAVVNFIVGKQAPDGSWGYQAGTAGDTSILGWEIQALNAARMGGTLVVPPATLKRAVAFLDKVASGGNKAVYGYREPTGVSGTSLTAVGLWCRIHVDGWTPKHPGLAEGVKGLLTKRPPLKGIAKPDMYYYYYATQVLHSYGGDEWQEWNEGKLVAGKRQGGMRDWLIGLQNRKDGPERGSWEPDAATIGQSCGRLGTTALSVLTLEVYYRHLLILKAERK